MARLRENTQFSSSSKLPLGLLNFFIYGTMVIFAAFFQLYLQDIGMDKMEIGSLMAIGPFISLLAHPFWRHLSDRGQNIRVVLLLMMTGLLVMGHLVFKANTYHMLYLSMVLLFFFQSPLLAQTNSLTLGYIGNNGRKFGTYRLWGSLGWTFIALTAGPIIDSVGQNGISLLFSITLMLATGSALLLPSINQSTNTPWISSTEIRHTLQNKYFLAFVIFGMLVSIPNSINGIFMPLFISDLGGSRFQVGGAVFLSTIFEVLAFVLLSRFLKRKMTYLMACLTFVSLLFALRWNLMAEATSPIQIILIQILHAVTFGGFFYVGTKLTALFLPRPLRSAGQAVYAFALSGMSGVIAGLLGGWIFQNFGPVIMYKMGVALALIGALGFGLMWRKIRKNGYSPVIPQKEEV
ncbi:PPP family 3-phenylpropionic acid transporter [Fontibacillus phaseoli]|uniref:PPP family 3-phenylpropionic acid transporter n=1 Tax=Fontibacillus phaseoli TaxID=1416533 RepID=A0A369BEY8_9BACL|nr:MFS transporter [Fontibacillus phaseoli]RCX19168.1 PPP family 3-phenylpropionic acid transporter [Fontibacillus phaseoli]